MDLKIGVLKVNLELQNRRLNYKFENPTASTPASRNKLFLLKHKDPPHQSLESAAPSLAQPAPQQTRTRTRTRIRTKIIIRIKVRIRIRTMIRTYGFIAKGQKDNKLKAARLIWPGGMSGAPESGAPLQLQRREERSHGRRTY